MDPVSALDQAIKLVGRLRAISKNIAEAEFKNVLAELLSELADAKVQIAGLKEQLAAQASEIQALKTAAPGTKPKPSGVKWGCYQFDGDDGLYCTACYDSRGVKSRTTRIDTHTRRCPVCGAALGS